MNNEGHTVSSAYNGEEALKKVLSNKFDLILMDVQMPVLDGLRATKLIRHYEIEEHVPRTPILALTASVFEEDRNSAKAAGMDGFISKPIDFNQMIEEITKVMNFSGPTLSLSKVAKSGTGSSSDFERAEELIRLLFNSFRKGYIEDKHMDELLSLISGEVEDTKLDELVSKIEQFEFEAAQRILQELTRSLGIKGVNQE